MVPNWQNRTLFHGDNLPFLRAMNSESVYLIATDPPFNKGRDFHATPDSLASGAKFQDRWSWERDVHEEWTDQITDDYPRLMEAIESARYAHSDGMGAFMCFMAVRLLAMHRVLKPTGSIYLHCDPTASHYLKAVMDAIFGWRNFRNDLTWLRRKTARRFHIKNESLLFYARDVKHIVFNTQYKPHKSEYLRRFNPDSTGRLCRTDVNPTRGGGGEPFTSTKRQVTSLTLYGRTFPRKSCLQRAHWLPDTEAIQALRAHHPGILERR